jgi:hypothetical protein
MKKQKQIWITALGCLLAAAMIAAQLFVFSPTFENEKQIEATEQSSDNETTQTIAIASFSIPSPIHVEIKLDSHVLFEILFEDKQEQPSAISETLVSGHKLLVTLFRVIISPNAP